MFKVESLYSTHKDTVKIEWNLGKRCNYDCSYCPSVIHDNFSPHTDISILNSTIEKLTELSKPVRISLTGGEPCVHPRIEELIWNIKRNDMWLSITTNGTRNVEWYSKQGELVDQFVFSIHFEHDYSNVMNVIKELKLFSRVKMLVHVMAHHKYMNEVKRCVEILEQYNVDYAIRRVRWTEGDHDLFDDLRYDQNDLDYILSKTATIKPNTILWYRVENSRDESSWLHANDVIKKHLNQYKNFSCNAGIESLMIDNDGSVYRATCRVGSSLGNIYNNTFNIPTEPVICDRNYCTCAADIPLTKVKND